MNILNDQVYIRNFVQTILLILAHCAKVSASEIPMNTTHVYLSGGLAAPSQQTAHTETPWLKILNSGGIVSDTEKSLDLRKTQLSKQVDMKNINSIDQIKSVLDPTGLLHLEQCTFYLTQDNMGIKNIKFKANLLKSLAKQKEIDPNIQRPSKNACKELFTLILH